VPPEGQALDLAALQAKLDEANARAAEQKSRYKHLKGKYLRQLARQQAMHEYMVRCPLFPSVDYQVYLMPSDDSVLKSVCLIGVPG
jgi:hypothetical protein